MLTGHLPFASEDHAEMEALHLDATPPRPSQSAPVSVALDAVVLRCLEKNPERRYGQVTAFLDALRKAAGVTTSRSQPPPVVAHAGAILLEVRIDSASHETMDDPLLDDLGSVLDTAEQKLRQGRFVLALQTGSSILGVRVLAGDAEGERRERQEILAAALALDDLLRNRAGRDPRLRISVGVHADRAFVRRTEAGADLVGGPILRVSGWSPPKEIDRVWASSQAVREISVPAHVMVIPIEAGE